MKRLKNRKFSFLILSFFLFLCPLTVKATNANVSFSGNNSVYVGNTITIKMYISGEEIEGGVVSAGGNLSFDSDYLEYVSGNGVSSPYLFQITPSANYIIAGLDTKLDNGITKKTEVFTFVFKAKKTGNTQVSLKNAKLSSRDAKVATTVSSKTISITNPPSSNNNLSSLSVSNGNINFNKNNTNYSVSVESNVTNITISATSEDSGASISGTGNKNLNYGNNKFDITVTAPSGVKKTYTINVNRKDSRSGNNKLSNLSVSGGNLNPKFNSNNENYSISVPYSISSLNINAKAEDSKAKVSISNNKLVAEETTAVKITVTAENGSTKTYTINATRGKDPNKVLSTNNYLSNLTVSSGTLSPAFNKEQENYIVYLPYEVDSIKINTQVEDTRYATVKIDGPDKLSTGNNNYKITVTAEDNSTKIYTLVVSRGINMTSESISSNVYLKEIKIKNGSIKGTFNKEVYNYTYTGGEVEAIPEDGNSTVTIITHDNITSIIVKSATGELGVYTLTLNKGSFLNIILSVGCLILIAGGLFVGYHVGKEKGNSKSFLSKIKKPKLKRKKEKQENN